MQKRRLLTAAAAGVGLSLAGLTLGVALQGCSSDGSDSTSGKRVVLHTRVTVDEAALTRFTSALGWEIELSQAAIAAGPFYYFDGVPPLVLQERPTNWQYAARFLGLSLAHAHPGHYQPGNAMGQMLESSSLDLLDGVADFPDGDGVSGSYRSARFTLGVSASPMPSPARVSGAATWWACSRSARSRRSSAFSERLPPAPPICRSTRPIRPSASPTCWPIAACASS